MHFEQGMATHDHRLRTTQVGSWLDKTGWLAAAR
jgi:hypothetical protein